jgi:hypothetical protein
MTRSVRRGSWAGYVLVAVIATLVAGGGIALASSSSGTVHGCKNKKTGALRIMSGCSKSEQVVVWNLKGATGATGATGVAGPSDAWEARTPGSTNVTGASVVLLSFAVPAGNYDVTGKVEEENDDTSHIGKLECWLNADTTTLDDMVTTAAANNTSGSGVGNATNIVHASYATTSGTTFSLTCNGKYGNPVIAVNQSLSAIKIGTFH